MCLTRCQEESCYDKVKDDGRNNDNGDKCNCTPYYLAPMCLRITRKAHAAKSQSVRYLKTERTCTVSAFWAPVVCLLFYGNPIDT